MFGRLGQWIEDYFYNAGARGLQRLVNDLNAPADDAGERPRLQLVLHAPDKAADEAPAKQRRKAE